MVVQSVCFPDQQYIRNFVMYCFPDATPSVDRMLTGANEIDESMQVTRTCLFVWSLKTKKKNVDCLKVHCHAIG